MKKVLIISILVVSLLSAKQVLVDTNDALSVKVSSNVANIDDNNTNKLGNQALRDVKMFE